MSWDGDADCLNCGLTLYGNPDPKLPFCDSRCEARFEERRVLRQLRLDMYRWNLRALLDTARRRLKIRR